MKPASISACVNVSLTARAVPESRSVPLPVAVVTVYVSCAAVLSMSVVSSIAVVSTAEKAEVARAAGADEVIVLGDLDQEKNAFKDAVLALTDGKGADLVMDVVGGDLFMDSLRALAPQGRLLVVGFASGQGIPEVKVNRLLLNNVDVRGVGWGAYAMTRPGYMQEQWAELAPMMESGVIKPPVGKVYALEDFGQALTDMDERRTLGKGVVRLRE